MGNKSSRRSIATTPKNGTKSTLSGCAPFCAEGTPIHIKYSSKIGEGGFSTVFKVKETKASFRRRGISKQKQKKTTAVFAVKRMVCKDDEWIIRCEEEIKMHRVCVHTNILPLLATSSVRCGRSATEYLLLLPLCPRGSLQDAIDRAGSLNTRSGNVPTSAFTEAECFSLFVSVCEGVQQIHSSGFSHRDLKPANVLFSANNVPMVMDLGSCVKSPTMISSSLDADMLYDNASVHSTPSYRAPELFMTTYPCSVGCETDVWSLGCLLYAMAFGRSPFEFGPGGTFERLAVMNGNVHFHGHGREQTRWRGGSGHGSGDDDGGDQIVVETHVLITLVKGMLSPSVQQRFKLDQVLTIVRTIVKKHKGVEVCKTQGCSDTDSTDISDDDDDDDDDEIAVEDKDWSMTEANDKNTEETLAFDVNWDNMVGELGETTGERKKKKRKKRKKKKKKKKKRTAKKDSDDDEEFGDFATATSAFHS